MTDTLPPTANKYIVPALAQGLGILSLFGGENRSFTAPEIGTLKPSTASIISGPRSRPGQASARTKSSQVACCGAKVLVSCWNPPTAIRALSRPFTISLPFTIQP